MWNPFTPIVRFLLGRNGALNVARQLRNEATGELKSALQSYITNVQQLNKTATTLTNLTRLMNTPKNNQTLAYNKRIGAAVAKMVNASKNAIFASKNANNARRAKEAAAQEAKAAKAAKANQAAANKDAAKKAAAEKAAANKAAANKAAAEKAANANAAEKLRWREAKISVQNLNKIMKGVNISSSIARRTRWMGARGVTNSKNAVAKAEANKEINNKRIFGKSKYKLLWENIIELPLLPPPGPPPPPVPPKPVPPPKPAAAGKPVVNVKGRMNAAQTKLANIGSQLSQKRANLNRLDKAPAPNTLAIQALESEIARLEANHTAANQNSMRLQALYKKLGDRDQITLEELNSIFAHLDPKANVNKYVSAWKNARAQQAQPSFVYGKMLPANIALNKRGILKRPKYPELWKKLLVNQAAALAAAAAPPPPPAPSPAPPQLPPKENRKVNVTGAPSGTQVNITRQLNASGQKYNAWNFADQSNAGKYNINNRNTNNPIVKLKKSQVNQNFNRVYALYNNNTKVRTHLVSVANTTRALKNLTAAAQKAGKAQNQTVMNAKSRLQKHHKALAVTEQAIRNVTTNTNMMKKIRVNGTPYMVQVSRKKSWGGQIQPWRITSANALQIFTINKANTNSPEVKFK